MVQPPSVEYLAKLRADEKDALFILKKIRYYAEQLRGHKTEYNRNKLEFWETKADCLIDKVPQSFKELKPDYNFKSLMEQYREGNFYETPTA